MTIESRRINELRPHPRQLELFGDLPEGEFQTLKRDIEERGLQHLPEILLTLRRKLSKGDFYGG